MYEQFRDTGNIGLTTQNEDNIKNTTQKTKRMNTENSGINKVVRNGKDYWFLYYIYSLIHVIKSC